MLESLVTRLHEWMASVEARHAVNPIVFLVLMVVCAPFFYYSGYRLIRSVTRKNGKGKTRIWSTVFLSATVVPYLYILMLGRDLPWWIYGLIGLLIGQSVYSLIRRITRKEGTES